MNYYINTATGRLEQYCTGSILRAGWPNSDPPFLVGLVYLPHEYQDVFFEKITCIVCKGDFFISHPELVPQVLRRKALEKGWRDAPAEILKRAQQVNQDQPGILPLHYRKGKIQPWDFITSQGMSFLEGNIIKYVTRYKHKNGAADLKKAQTYLNKLISEVEKCHE